MQVSDLAAEGFKTFMLGGASRHQPRRAEPANRRGPDASGAEVTRPDGPCGQHSDADPSSNLCFENADSQISTLPRLLATWHGRQAAGAVVDSVLDAFDGSAASAVALGDLSVESPPAPAPSDNDSCSTDPAQCRALPPLAPTVTIDIATTPAQSHRTQLDVPGALDGAQQPPWARLRIGPHPGHRAPPDQPPRA